MPNRLAAETSPYLRQHADNPVDWYPWGDEALAAAREQDKPILLSIGYSACHWCHVMAHESFEDAEVAAQMNASFINVKVDREERPDLDQIYQTAHSLLTRRNGGWPLTMFLAPDQAPFFGGTYFPKTAHRGMPGFIDLLPQIAAAYRNQRGDITQQSTALLAAFEQTLPPPAGGELSAIPLDVALRELKNIFDEDEGGIGAAPKFPHPSELDFCLRRAVDVRDDYARGMVRLTLTKMAEGGICDQLGGGFCRYSVDAHWTIPHFEKMLYDNGPLLHLYSDLWLVEPQPLFARTVSDTAAWAMREMQASVNPSEGGYCSSLDADSEHVEGKFYVWTPDEVVTRVSADEYAVTAPHYGLDVRANFEHEFWHLRVTKPLATVAKRLDIPLERAQQLLDSARAKLFTVREARVRPGRDDKVLTSWNALMIKGMARAARAFGNTTWLASARKAQAFVRSTLWRDGRLLATYKDGTAHLNAYLDDYAFLLNAQLELLQHEFKKADLDWACALADVLLEQFEDRALGGFFFVSHDHERLLHRTKTGRDHATPSGNGIAALALNRLGHLVGEPRYNEAARRTLQAFKLLLDNEPMGHTSLCAALEEELTPADIVILRGDGAAQWQRELNRHYLPHALVLAIPDDVSELPAVLAKPVSGTVNAFVCRGVTCLAPIADVASLLALLNSWPAQVG
ncbi:MAG: thioredoxin protein [Betaproteobacteria bacterium]|nr:thioredoxin protein [Betaproteobacteria bacterium]